MSAIATAFDTLFTFVAIVLFGAIVSLATLAYANNELFITVITTGSEGVSEFIQAASLYIQTTF